MKKIICIFTVYLLFFTATGYSAIGISAADNPHNLSSNSNNAVEATTETRICVFCHTPHGAVAQTALWNREDPDTMGAFPLYSSATLNIDDPAIVGISEYDTTDYPNGASRMCLSCHDGVTSIGTVINGSAIGMTFDTLNAFGSGTIDLATSHPISFVYNAAVRDAVNAAELAGGGTGTEYQLSANGKVKTEIGADTKPRMQCTTCHDPHSDTKNGTYDLPFWANYNGDDTQTAADYDGTCQACHQGADWGGSWGGGPQLPHTLP